MEKYEAFLYGNATVDYEGDGLPELNVEFHSLSYGPQLFSLEWKENSLKISCSHRDGVSAIFTLFEKGYIKSVRSLSATRTTIEYISPEGEKAAKYGIVRTGLLWQRSEIL